MDSRGYSIIEYLEDWDLPTTSGEKINSEREKKKKKKKNKKKKMN
jgi:hypothetical protein